MAPVPLEMECQRKSPNVGASRSSNLQDSVLDSVNDTSRDIRGKASKSSASNSESDIVKFLVLESRLDDSQVHLRREAGGVECESLRPRDDVSGLVVALDGDGASGQDTSGRLLGDDGTAVVERVEMEILDGASNIINSELGGALGGFGLSAEGGVVGLGVGDETNSVDVVGGRESESLEEEAVVGVDELSGTGDNWSHSLDVIERGVVGKGVQGGSG